MHSVYNDDAPSYHTVAKWMGEFKEPELAFEDSPRTGRPSTITTDENIEAVERFGILDQQTSLRRIAYELIIPTITVYEIISNHLGMKKVSTRWEPALLTPIQHANRVDCCQELLQESEVNSDNYFHRIVTGDEIWLYSYDRLSQEEAKIWKKPGEETLTRLHRTGPPDKIMMIISWDK